MRRRDFCQVSILLEKWFVSETGVETGVNSPQLTDADKHGLKRLPDSGMGNEVLATELKKCCQLWRVDPDDPRPTTPG